jgi:hypothetical protein
MIDIAWAILVWAGLFATLTVALLVSMGRWVGWIRIDPVELVEGVPRAQDGGAIRRAARAALSLLAGTLALPLVYAVIFEWLARADASAGLLVGIAHGIAAGVLMPVLERTAPRALRRPARDRACPGRRRPPGRRTGGRTPCRSPLPESWRRPAPR